MYNISIPEIPIEMPDNLDADLRSDMQASDHTLNFLYERFQLAHSYELSDFILEQSESISDEIDDETIEEKGQRAFIQGMLFSLAVTNSWLLEEDFENASKAAEKTSEYIDKIRKETFRENSEEPLSYGETVLWCGLNGLKTVKGYEEMVEAYAGHFEPSLSLHDYFKSGAGLMIRTLVVARQLRLRQETEKIIRQSRGKMDKLIGKLLTAENS